MMEDGEAGIAAEARPLLGGVNIRYSSMTFSLAVSTIVAQCSALANGCAVAYTSPAESGITEDLGLSSSQYAIFGSLFTAGGLVSCFISGKTADHIGRKKTLWLSQFCFTLGWLGIVLAKNAWWLYIGRFSMGVGAGFTFYAVPVYMAEISPTNVRGALTAASQLTAYLGFALVYITGNIVSWRVLAIIGSVPGIIQVIGLFCIPESPRWLAKVGRYTELEVALQRLRGKDVDIHLEAETIKEYTMTCDAFEDHSKTRLTDLFQRKYAPALLVCIGLMLVQQFGGASAIAAYVSDVFEIADFSTSIGGTGLALIQIPVTILGLSLMDVWGRRPLLMVSLSGMCLGCFLVASSFLFQDFNLGTEITPVLVFIGLMLYIACLAFGTGFIPLVIMSEIFPVNMKGAAGSLVLVISSVCSLITTYTFLFALEWSSAGVFFMFFAICGGGLLFAVKFVPETKCRTLEDIQKSMVHFQ
ncbi:unnamed protein product [Rhodiola kirilowii]